VAARLPKWLIKAGIAVVACAGLGVLFMRSLEQARSTPFTIDPRFLTDWTISVVQAPTAASPILVLQPHPDLVPGMFGQVFARNSESLNSGGGRGIPLVLQAEFDRAFAGSLTPGALADVARNVGLGSGRLEPRCVAHFHVSEPGATRQLYAALFEVRGFDQFRRQIAMQTNAGAAAGSFDPAALSPVLFIAATDPAFDRWLPLRVDPATDCVAPLVAG
jgi:hypothetical protein